MFVTTLAPFRSRFSQTYRPRRFFFAFFRWLVWAEQPFPAFCFSKNDC